MFGWKCPHCQKRHDAGDHPDHWMFSSSKFKFDCDCGEVIIVNVDWSPQFTVVTHTT